MSEKFPFSALFSGDDNKINEYLDRKVSSAIASAVESAGEVYSYSLSDLGTKVNEDETLREYLEDGIKEFGLSVRVSEIDSKEDLNRVVCEVDNCWRYRYGEVCSLQ